VALKGEIAIESAGSQEEGRVARGPSSVFEETDVIARRASYWEEESTKRGGKNRRSQDQKLQTAPV